MKCSALIGGLAAAAVLVAGCGSAPSPKIERYLLAPGLESDATPPLDGPTLRITAVELAPHLEGIVILRDEARIERLVYHQWAGPLDALAEGGLREALAATGAFRSVLDSRSASVGAWNLRVRVNALEIDDRASPPVAVCELEADLSLEGRRTLTWSGRERSRSGVAAGGSANRLVEALGRAFAAAARDLAARIPPATLQAVDPADRAPVR